MTEEPITIVEESEPEPTKEELITQKLEENKRKRKEALKRARAKSRKKAPPIRTEPPAYPQDALRVPEESKKATEPWRPASMLTCKPIPGMRPRWVRKDLLEKRMAEGWQPRISTDKGRIDAPEKTLVDGKPLSSYVVKRNLVLCDMPEEMAKSREEYYRKLTDSGLEAQKNELERGTAVGGKSYNYGDIEVSR